MTRSAAGNKNLNAARVIISWVVSIPVAWYFMAIWLKRFEYRTEISWWVFAITCLSALVMTLLTVSFKAIGAARTSPAKSLRTD
jgi:hypothetical protein